MDKLARSELDMGEMGRVGIPDSQSGFPGSQLEFPDFQEKFPDPHVKLVYSKAGFPVWSTGV